MAAKTAPTTFAMRFNAKIGGESRRDIYEAIVINGNPRRICDAAYAKLRRKNLDNPKQVFGARFRFLCVKTAPLIYVDKQTGEESEPTVPKHAVKVS